MTKTEGSFSYHDILSVAKIIADLGITDRFAEDVESGAFIERPEEYVSWKLNDRERKAAESFEERLGPFFGKKPWRGKNAPSVSYYVPLQYLFFLTNLVSGHYRTGADPYEENNREKINLSVEYLKERNKARVDASREEAIEFLLSGILYGNKYEGCREYKKGDLDVASDHRKELVQLILSVGQEGVIDLFIDNVGPELAANLQLIDYLIKNNIVGKMRVHVKAEPFAISDVWGRDDGSMMPYITSTLETFRQSGDFELAELARRFEEFVRGERIVIERNEFLTRKTDLMEAKDELNGSLSGSGVVIFVGDYLYRSLMGNRNWPHTEDASVLNDILSYIKVPVGMVRMIKSDIKLGVPLDTPDDGTVGIVQVAGDTIHVKGKHSDFSQEVESMRIEFDNVTEAKEGDKVGIKVIQPVHTNDKVYKVIASEE